MYTQLFSKYIFRLIKTAVGTFATHSTNQRRKATTEWMLTSSMRWRIKINNSNVKRLPSYASLIHLPWRNGAPKIGTCKSVRSETLMTMEANAEKLSELPNESNHVRHTQKLAPKSYYAQSLRCYHSIGVLWLHFNYSSMKRRNRILWSFRIRVSVRSPENHSLKIADA